jgi:hypothetical protein
MIQCCYRQPFVVHGPEQQWIFTILRRTDRDVHDELFVTSSHVICRRATVMTLDINRIWRESGCVRAIRCSNNSARCRSCSLGTISLFPVVLLSFRIRLYITSIISNFHEFNPLSVIRLPFPFVVWQID